MLHAALVTKEISPNIRLLPLLISIAMPRPPKIIKGSSQEEVVIIKIKKANKTPIIATTEISLIELLVDVAIDTALPVRELR